MKICFLLQRRFAYIGHEIAKILKEDYGVKEFCGYSYMRSSFNFLKSQTDIKYTQLLHDEEIHKQYKTEKLDLDFLRSLEENYGLPNLWPYIYIDRIVRYNMFLREYPYDTPSYTHEEMLKILQIRARAIIKFFDEEKPEVVIFSLVGGIADMLLYEIARKRGIKTLVLYQTRVGIRQTVSQEYGTFSYVIDVFKKLQSGQNADPRYHQEAQTFLNEFRNKPTPYSNIDTPDLKPVTRRKQFKFLIPNNLIRGISWIFTVWKNYLLNPHRDDYDTVKPWHYLIDKIRRKLRILVGFEKFYDEPDYTEDYAFFPLQYEPEKASMLYAPFYTDQLWLAKLFARSLPANYKLYIKEHPAMFGFRTHKYYKELKKIPNVKIVRPTLKSFDLIRRTKLTITTTGSGGWESILFKKPVITFGKVFYNELSAVKHCSNPEILPFIVRDQLTNHKHNEKELLNMLTAICQESAIMDIVRMWDVEGAANMDKKGDQLSPLVNYIAQKLNLPAK